MDRFQPIYDIAELCAKKGIRHVVLSPGSRCAPLTLSFVRHKKLTCYTISDERSAAFIGLGLAQQTRQPVALVCTSGSAGLNYSPAIAEAFFAQVPLVVFTADRPAEWIGQQDGQTIYQQGIYSSHVKQFFQLPQDYDHPDSRWAINRMVNEAVNRALQHPYGPVHINAPFREPLYPDAKTKFRYSENIRVIQQVQADQMLSEESQQRLSKEWDKASTILMVGGQQEYEEATMHLLSQVASKHHIPVVGELLSNLHGLEKSVRHADLFLGQAPVSLQKKLRPDLLITFGKGVISKNLKLFLRQYPPASHWHIQPSGQVADTYQNVTRLIHTHPHHVFNYLNLLGPKKNETSKIQIAYRKCWMTEEDRTAGVLKDFIPQKKLGELEVVKQVMNMLPNVCNLHLANSMSVRYANMVGLAPSQKGVHVYSNRGTSGIDGSNSTAMGHALVSQVSNVLITGDMAFFYDRNAFWNNYPVSNLRVVVLNNHGGVIFSILDGPSSLPEGNDYFVTRQKLTAKSLCQEFGFTYLTVKDGNDLKRVLPGFLAPGLNIKVLEIESGIDVNTDLFKQLKKKIKKEYEARV